MDALRRRYEEVYRGLSAEDLQRGGAELLRAQELLEQDDRWLGFYTDDGIMFALERYGLFDALRRRGFERFEVVTQTHDPEQQMLRLFSALPACEEPLIELVARRAWFEPQPGAWRGGPFAVLQVEWLQLQNPLATFRPGRRALPGQELPGLGVGRRVFELLRNICRRLDLCGLVTTPAFLHNAIFYGQEFTFVDPSVQGYFAALCRDLLPALDHQPGAASWALRLEMVRDQQGRVAQWRHAPLLASVGPALKGYSRARSYRAERDAELGRWSFSVDREAVLAILEERGLS
jgi:hypothetical protein